MRKSTKPRSTSRISDDEPRWKQNNTLDEVDNSEHQLAQMLNWYNYNKTAEDAKKYFVEYLSQSGESADTLTKIAECTDYPLSSSVGWLCRIKTVNGDVVPKKYDKNIQDATSKILQVIVQKSSVEKETATQQKTSPNIQDYLENQLRELHGELAMHVDDFLEMNCSSKFTAYEWFQKKAVKHQQAKKIADYYEKTILAELKEAMTGECEQLKEGYSFLKPSGLKKFVAFVQSIVDDAKKWSDVAKQVSLNSRAPRVKKPKPAGKQVAKLNYLREHENLKSIVPSQIVGATQLWVYNIKYRTLGVYVCTNPHGFSVKGSTILNYSATESVCKKLRKPEEVIPKVLEANKVALRKIIPTIRAKEKKLTGRINRDTILLKAV